MATYLISTCAISELVIYQVCLLGVQRLMMDHTFFSLQERTIVKSKCRTRFKKSCCLRICGMWMPPNTAFIRTIVQDMETCASSALLLNAIARRWSEWPPRLSAFFFLCFLDIHMYIEYYMCRHHRFMQCSLFMNCSIYSRQQPHIHQSEGARYSYPSELILCRDIFKRPTVESSFLGIEKRFTFSCIPRWQLDVSAYAILDKTL